MKEFTHNVWQFLLPAFLAFGTFVSPIAGVLVAVGMFIAADTAFARYRVYMQHKKNKAAIELHGSIPQSEIEKGLWRSRRFRAGIIPKVLTYNCFVLSFFVMDTFVINEFTTMFTQIPFALTKILAMVLIWIELKSIDESFESIKGKSLFVHLVDMLKSAKKINKQMSDVNESKEKEKAPENTEA